MASPITQIISFRKQIIATGVEAKKAIKLFFLTILLLAINNVYANMSVFQVNLVSIELDNVSVKDVFDEIERTTQYKFLYYVENINLNRKVSVYLENQNIDRLLKQLFKKTNVKFITRGNQIILTKILPSRLKGAKSIKEKELKISTVQQNISGYVYDENDLPLSGVSVIVEGTQRGISTNFDGYYGLEVNKGEVLIFSYLGFLTQSVRVGNDMVYDVKMTPTAFSLDAIELVSTGYSTVSKERATGSFASVDEEIIENKINQNIFDKISGEVSGLQTGGRGALGFTIRGTSTLSNGIDTSPLVVVDGVPLEGGFDTVNPNDVAKITVLKDAAAASIWGVRAANGVIVIITKKGVNNEKITVNFSTNLAVTPQPDMFNSSYGNVATQIEYQQELVRLGYFNQTALIRDNNVTFQSLSQLPPAANLFLRQQEGGISQGAFFNELEQLLNTDLRKEYTDLILRDRIWSQYNLSVSGGGENHTFRASASYNKNENEHINTGANQWLTNISNSFNLGKKLKVNTNINISKRTDNLEPNEPDDGLSSPFAFFPRTNYTSFFRNYSILSRILDDSGNYLPSELGASRQASDILLNRGYTYDWTHNVRQEFDNADNTRDNTTIRLQTGLEYNVTKNLTASVRYQLESQNQRTRNFYNQKTYTVRTRVNSITQIDDDGNAESFPIPIGGILDLESLRSTSQTIRAQLDYDGSFKEGFHKLNILAGYEARKIVSEINKNRRYGYDDNSLTFFTPDFNTTYSVPFSLPFEFSDDNTIIPVGVTNPLGFNEDRFLSYYLNTAYTIDDTYTFSGSLRLDDTNSFSRENSLRNIPLYSVGFKYNLTRKLFYDSTVVDNLQLRTTYGVNGNVDTGISPFLIASLGRNNAPFNNLAAYVSLNPNPNLRLERTSVFNLGLDFSLFKGFAAGSVEVYRKNSVDLLSQVALNPTLGISSNFINGGELRNDGIDINLTLTPIQRANFKYTTTGIFSLNKNQIISISDDQQDISSLINGFALVEGLPLNTVYAYRFAGLDGNGAPQFFDENNGITDVRTAIDNVDALKEIGTTTPTYYGSWINQFNYKNLTLRVLTTFDGGHIFNNSLGLYKPLGLPSANIQKNFSRRWKNPGDENITRVPALVDRVRIGLPGYNQYAQSDELYDTAAVIRLSQINMNYRFSEKLTQKLSMNSFTIGLQVDNVAFWAANRWGVDPSNINFPNRPRVTLNLSTSF